MCTVALYVGGKLKLFNHFFDFFMMTLQFYSISFHQLENFSLHINQFLWFDRPMYIVIIKGGLISESYSIRSNLQKKVPNLSTIHLKIRCLGSWFGIFFGDLSQSENLSEINLPLLFQAFPTLGWSHFWLSNFISMQALLTGI